MIDILKEFIVGNVSITEGDMATVLEADSVPFDDFTIDELGLFANVSYDNGKLNAVIIEDNCNYSEYNKLNEMFKILNNINIDTVPDIEYDLMCEYLANIEDSLRGIHELFGGLLRKEVK